MECRSGAAPCFAAMLLLLGACAPARGGPLLGPRAMVFVAETGQTAYVGSGAEVYTAPTFFAAPRQQVWNALLAAHSALNLPLEAADPSTGQTLTRVLAHGTLLDQPVSTFLTCGGTTGAAELADHYRVEVRLHAVLSSPTADRRQLQLYLSGAARDHFRNTASRPCFTRGVLEQRLAGAMRARLEPGHAPFEPLITASDVAPDRPAHPRVELPAPQELPGPVRPDQATPQLRPAHPLVLLAGGVAAGALATAVGSQVGANCEERCLNARGTLGPLVGNTLLIPLGTHLTNRGRGRLVQSFLLSAGWAALGMVAGGFTGEDWPLYATAPAQVLTSVLIEHSSTGPR